MKKTILLTLLTSVTLQATAQISVAPEIGVGISNVKIGYLEHTQSTPVIGNISNRAGLRIGVVVNIPVVKGFFVQPGLFAPVKPHRYYKFNDVHGRTRETFLETVPVYLEVPLNVGYELKISKASRVFVTAGAYAAYVVSSTSRKYYLYSGGSSETDIKPFDFGTAFSAGYKLGRRAFARVQYSLGLKNIAKDALMDIKKQSLSLTIGYAVSIK